VRATLTGVCTEKEAMYFYEFLGKFRKFALDILLDFVSIE